MTGLTRRAALMLPVLATGCAAIDDILADSKTPLAGKRERVGTAARGLSADPADTRQIVLPAPTAMPEWPQPGGSPSHVVGNIAVTGFSPAWRSSIGEGGGYRRKITAQPIVIPGRVVTMDSDGMVAAFALENGRRVWRADTQGDEDRSTNVGGGVSYADGAVFASTGRAEIMALDAGSGAIRWRRPLGAPARSAPTVADGRLYVITLDNRIQAFNAADGERLWSYQATATATTLLGQAAPAFAEGIVVAGFGSGELVALRAESGAFAWSDSLATGRGRNSVLDISAIRALPVIDRGRVFAIGVGGLLVSLDLRSGRRLWERESGGLQTPWIAGDWLFVQTSDQTLAAIGREDGQVRWLHDLPRYDDPVRRSGTLLWAGPILAGGKLILAGSNGYAFSVNPLDGAVIGKAELQDAAAVSPVAAAGTILFVCDDGSVQAFR